MKLPKLKKRYLAIVLAVGVALGVGGVAYAFFSATGSGTGTASVGPRTMFSITPHNVTGTITQPGATTGTHITFAVEDVATYKEHISTVTTKVFDTGGDIKSLGSRVTGCQWTWFQAAVIQWRTDTTGPTYTTLTAHPITITITPTHYIHVMVNVTLTTLPHTTQSKCEGKDPRVTITVAK